MPRNLIVCLDGTRNEPETGATNVVRVYNIAVKDGRQLAYYDPGVGTLGTRGAVTRTGKRLTRVAGLVVGYGVKENVEEAYRYLMDNYQTDDRIYIFGFRLSNVAHGRHALAIDERRRPYHEYRFDVAELAKGNLCERWFIGVHSDVGGQFEEHKLSDIALKWIVDEAKSVGLFIDPKRYGRQIGVNVGQSLPDNHALGEIHTNGFGRAILGAGWHRRVIRPGDEIHPSVHDRIDATAGTAKPYRPPLPKR